MSAADRSRITAAPNDSRYTGALHALVDSARRLFRLQFPLSRYPGMAFDSPRWDFTRSNVSHGNKKCVATFLQANFDVPGRLKQREDELPDHFRDLFKAWIVHVNLRAAQAILAAHASRYLWGAIENLNQSSTFTWADLRNKHFEYAENLMADRLSRSSQVTYSRRLRRFVNWAIDNEVVSEAVTWTGSVRSENGASASADLRDARLDRIPQRGALEALGEIYLRHAVEPRDRLMICSCGILLVAGFRIGELLTLPVDCLASEVHQGRKRWFIRYWKEKTRGGHFKEAVRYLSPLGAELARACIEEIKTLTAAARAQTKRLENDENRVAIPWGQSRWLSKEETGRAFAVEVESLGRLIRDGHLAVTPHRTAGRNGFRYLRSEVEAVLLERRPALLSLVIEGARVQRLSETLLIESCLSANGAKTSELLVKHMPGSALTAFVGASEHRTPSAFTRFGYRPPFESGARSNDFRMRSHMFRHWLNTVANKAGMTAFQITLWMQRDDVRRTQAYLHPASDIADMSRELLRDGKLRGQPADLYANLNGEEGERYLATMREGHETDMGTCLRALRRTNCELEKSCAPGCSDFVWNPTATHKLSTMRLAREAVSLAIRRLDDMKSQGHRVHARQRSLLRAQLKDLDGMIAETSRVERGTSAAVN